MQEAGTAIWNVPWLWEICFLLQSSACITLGLLHRDLLGSTGLPAQAPLLQVQQVSSPASSAQFSRNTRPGHAAIKKSTSPMCRPCTPTVCRGPVPWQSSAPAWTCNQWHPATHCTHAAPVTNDTIRYLVPMQYLQPIAPMWHHSAV